VSLTFILSRFAIINILNYINFTTFHQVKSSIYHNKLEQISQKRFNYSDLGSGTVRSGSHLGDELSFAVLRRCDSFCSASVLCGFCSAPVLCGFCSAPVLCGFAALRCCAVFVALRCYAVFAALRCCAVLQRSGAVHSCNTLFKVSCFSLFLMVAADFKGGPLRFPERTAAFAVVYLDGTAPSLMTSLNVQLRARHLARSS